jgi:hypothetical protein
MIAVVPVPEPVMDDPGGDGLVVTLEQAGEEFRSQGGGTLARAASTARCASRRTAITSSAQDCSPPGPSFATALHRLMTCWQHCWILARPARRCW